MGSINLTMDLSSNAAVIIALGTVLFFSRGLKYKV
jgi:hypothetical protein